MSDPGTPRDDDPATRSGEGWTGRTAAVSAVPAASATSTPNASAVVGPGQDGVVAGEPTDTAVQPAPPAPPPVPEPVQRPVETAAATEDAPPKRHGNRLVATFWVLFAMLVFEVGYLVLIALIALLLGGPQGVPTTIDSLIHTPYIPWVPVVVFGVLYELTVLLLGRAGRFAYVVASLVVGLLVWILSVQLFILLPQHALGSASAVAGGLEAPEFILLGVLAREVMLWTGFAVGARGIRVRRRDRAARREYEAQHRDSA